MAIAVVGIQVKVGGIKDATKQFESLKRSVDEVVNSVKSLSRVKAPRIGNLNIVQGGVGVFDQKSIDQSAKLNTGLTKVASTTRNVTNNITKMGSVTNNTTTKITNLNRALATTGKVARATGVLLSTGLGKALRSVGGEMSAFGRRLTTFGSVLSTFGFRLTSFLSLPLAGAIGGSVRAAVQFEDAITSLITKVGLSIEEVDGLSDAVLALAPTLGADPVDLLTAAYQPLSRGIRDTAVAMDILTVSAKASAIGLGTTEDIAKLVTSVMVAYGDSAGNAAKITDTLTSAIQFGSAEADEFVAPMGRAIGLASGLGVSFEELTAFMGTFAATGAPVTSVVTGMNRVMATFINPTEEAKDAFAALDTSVNELVETIRTSGFAATILELARAADEANIPLSDMFGRITGLNAVMFLAGNASDLYLETLAQIESGAGSLDRAFSIVTESTSFQLKVFQSSLKSTGIIIGDILLPALNKILAAVTPIIAAIGQFARLNPKVVLVATAFALLAAAVGPVIIGVGIITSSIGVIIAALGSFVTVIGTALAILTPFGAALLAVAGAIGTLFVALKALTSEFELNFNNIARNALIWGQNIMIELANGLARGFVYVVEQLTELATLFAYWLAPGSPPRLLPDLINWGSNIVNSLMEGFALADFDLFDDISNIVEQFIRSLGEKDDAGIIDRIFGSREAIADAIAQLRETGTVASDTISNITRDVGDAIPGMNAYIETLIRLAAATADVADAQAEIDRINSDFAETVKPLNDELESIADRFDEVKLAQEREALQDILDDPRAPELARELALLQLRRLELRQQVGEAEDQRDIELELANARLAAAETERDLLQERADLQRAGLDLMLEQNNLMKEQASILERLANAAKKAVASGAAIGGGGGGFQTPDSKKKKVKPPRALGSLSDIIGQGFTEAGAELQKAFEAFVKKLQKPFEPLLGPGGLIAQLADEWRGVFETLENLDQIDLKKVAKKMLDDFVRFGKGTLRKTLPNMWDSIKETFAIWAAKNFNLFQDDGLNIAERIIIGLGKLRLWVIDLLFKVAASVFEWLSKVDWLKVGLTIVNLIILGLEQIRDLGLKVLNKWLPDFINWFNTVDWAAVGESVADALMFGLWAIGRFIGVFLPTWKLDIINWFNGIDWSAVPANLVNGIMDGLALLSAGAIDALLDMWGAMLAWFGDIDWQKVGEDAAKLVTEGLDTIIEFVTTGLPRWMQRVSLWFNNIDWKQLGDNVVTHILEGLAAIYDFITLTLPAFWNDIKAWFFSQDWAQIGIDMIAGIISGVASMLQALINAVIGVAQGAWDAFIRFWESRSPSKRMEGGGVDIVQGLINGIMGMERQLMDAVTSTSGTAYNAMLPVGYDPDAPAGGINQFQIGPNTIANGMDDAIFAAKVKRVVAGAVR